MEKTFLPLTLIVSVTAVFFACFIFLYFYFTRNFNFWIKLGIPYVKPLPFVGNVKDVVFLKANIGMSLKTFYDDHSDKPYVGIFVFDQPSLVILDQELMKNILVKDAHIFINRTVSADEKLDPLFGKMIFMLEGQRWRNVRLNLTSVFTSAKMKMMFHLVVICGRELVKYLDTLTVEGK
jgi:cytochrome P450 family 6